MEKEEQKLVEVFTKILNDLESNKLSFEQAKEIVLNETYLTIQELKNQLADPDKVE